MRPFVVRATFAAVAITSLVASACSGVPGRTGAGGIDTPIAAAAGATPGPCTGDSASSISHVIVIVEENKSETIVNKKSMPYLKSLTKQCGLATNAHNLTHPSLANYIGLLSGQVQGRAWSHDVLAASSPQSQDNLFHQLGEAGRSWGVFAQSMPENCFAGNSGTYYARHTAAPYFDDINGRGGSSDTSCATSDVPLGDPAAGPGNNLYNALYGIDGAELPAFSLVAPDVCNDLHGQKGTCSGAGLYGAADRFLQTWVSLIVASPGYALGNVAVLILWDEGKGKDQAPGEACWAETIGGKNAGGNLSCWVADVVVSPGTTAGARSGVVLNHYDVLAAIETLLGLSVLPNDAAASGSANGTAADFLSAFGLH